MKLVTFKILKHYFWFILALLLMFLVFIYLESNNQKNYILLNAENELNPQSVHVLNQAVANKSVIFEIFTHPDSSIAKKIKQFFSPYKRINNNIQIKFIDPIAHPSEVNSNGISMQGEILLKFLNKDSSKKINITELSESSIINALLSLFNDKDEWLVFAEGYGMKTIDDDSEQGLSNLLIQLKKVGFQVARMPLNKAVILPENVKAIILPAPTETINVDIVEWLKNQSDKGVAIWWLNDVGINHQTYLELMFDIFFSGELNLDNNNAASYVSSFPNHPITENFNQPIYIAQATEIIASELKPLFVNTDNVTFAVTKEFDNSRLIITGDSDFIRNQFINIAANKSMTVKMIDWLLYNDDRINIPVKINQNTQLLLSQTQLLILSLLFLIIIPLIYLCLAFIQWRRNHAQ